MAIKIILLRRVTPEKENDLRPLLIQLRNLAKANPGYTNGETLRNMDDPGECLVITEWKSLEDWNEWLSTSTRQAVQQKIDDLLGTETRYQIYLNG